MNKRSAVFAYLLSLIPFTQIIQIKFIPIFVGSAIISLESKKINAENIDFYSNRAMKRAGYGDIKGAISDIDKVIEMDPKYFNAYYNRGNLKSRIEDCNEAIEDLNKTIRITPYLPYTFFLRVLFRNNLMITLGC